MTIHKLKKYVFSASIALILSLANLGAAENLLKNGDFSTWHGDKPAAWNIRSSVKYTKMPGSNPKSASLHLKLEKAVPERSGEILQKFPITPGTEYRFTGHAAGEAQMAMLQIKLFKDGKELKRVSSRKNKGADWEELRLNFSSEDADSAAALIRWSQEPEKVGKSVAFTDLAVTIKGPLIHTGKEVPPRAVTTYNSAGLYWKPTGGMAGRSVSVSYRKEGERKWEKALPLWFDDMEHADDAYEHSAEYRGSIVYLEPDTTYEAKLELENGPKRTITFKTQSDDFPIARTVVLPATMDEIYEINEGGSAEEGYVLYEAAPNSVWDAKNKLSHQVKVNASYVIVKGLKLVGAKNHGIVLGDVQHVIIDACDISGWGETMKSGQARNMNSAIYARSKALRRITVQNCDLHHPRSDSNSWNQQRPGTTSKHPEGPQGISFFGGQGEHVIRFNKIYSDIDHMFNDGMGEWHNHSYGGFLVRDSDVHDNYVSHCWDDALEIEGADMNIRVWNNYIDMTYGALGSSAASLGPVYFFRNVYAESRKHEGTESNDFRGHYMVKIGNPKKQWTHGRIYVFHNTTLQPPPFEGSKDLSSGAQSGVVFTSKSNLQENIVTRNNLFHLRKDRDWAIRDTQRTLSNDYDYDMHNGRVMFKEGSYKHAIKDIPTYRRASDGLLELVPGTPGHDDGVYIPNFNERYTGKAPDIGAVETDAINRKPKLWPAFPESPTAKQPAE